jgi:hypothetical protein
MPEIRPITDFHPSEAAAQIQALIRKERVRNLLRVRHLPGVLSRNGGDSDSVAVHLREAQKKHASGAMAVLAIVDDRGNLMGLGTAQPGLPLHKLPTAAGKYLPPRFFPARYREIVQGKNPNIAAWTDETTPDEDALAYAGLTLAYNALARQPGSGFHAWLTSKNAAKNREDSDGIPSADTSAASFAPWTIEPYASPAGIHGALREAGLMPLSGGRYDDFEDRRHPVPLSTLYVYESQPTTSSTA